ncbi:hypothetical protein J7I86_19390 [Arthrobacter sp. ISL-95]|nr:hypothetical protein [Arthrobacter sp. ISL-95]
MTETRKLSRETIERFRLGVVLGSDVSPTNETVRGFISIPYLSPTGVLSMRFRRPPESDAPMKYFSPKGTKTRVFNTNALLDPGHWIAIAEGECLPGSAEVLTSKGWICLDEWDGEQVAQWDETGQLLMVSPTAKVEKPYAGDLIAYRTKGYTSVTTPGHRMPQINERSGNLAFTTADAPKASGLIPRVGMLDGPGIPLLDDEIRLLLAIAADFTIDTRKNGAKYVRAGITKARKVERLEKLAASLGIEISNNPLNSAEGDEARSICFHIPRDLPVFKRLPVEWIAQATSAQRELILEEMVLWDGNSVPKRKQTEFSSKSYEDAKWMQTMAHTSGRCSSIIERANEWGKWYKVSILHGKQTSSWQGLAKKQKREPFEGRVFCLTVPSGAFLVRQEGHISVTGNCDTMAATQCGIPAIGIPGVQSWAPYMRNMLSGFSRIIVMADNDDKGQGLAFGEMIAEQLEEVKIILAPKGHDVNSALVELGPAGLREHFGVDKHNND